jgi:protein SCO1/2
VSVPTPLKVAIAFNLIASALLGLFVCAMCGVVVALAGCGRQTPAVAFNSIDVTGADFGRDFRLFDADGRIRTLADFRGQYVMLFFGFTQCPDVCPTALARALEVRRKLGPDGARVQVIFITGRSYTIDHTAITYLLDPQGRLRLAVRPDQPADQVAADLRALMGSSS